MGDVHRPGGFPIPESGNATALQALALAEGLGVAASPQHAHVLRRREDQQREDIPVNLTRILEHKDRDVTLRPDDVLYVPNSKSKNAALRGIEAAIQLGTGVAIYHR
jgi:polysaccharide export outer membrane protein